MDQGGCGEWSGFVSIGAVDRDIEGLVGDLPKEGAFCLSETFLASSRKPYCVGLRGLGGFKVPSIQA